MAGRSMEGLLNRGAPQQPPARPAAAAATDQPSDGNAERAEQDNTRLSRQLRAR